MSLSDFLIDGLKLKKTWEGRWLAIGAAFTPPLVFVFTYQKGFYLALQYAGTIVAVLLGIIPACMAWMLKQNPFYKKFWGKSLLLVVIATCCAVVLFDLWN